MPFLMMGWRCCQRW